MIFIGIDRSVSIAKIISPYLEGGASIIDIGAGTCRVAARLSDMAGVNITPVDTTDYNKTDLPLVVYDGHKLPYENEAFDAAILVFTLHHAEDAAALLEEAKRVAKSRVIVLEDTPIGPVEKWLWRQLDFRMNHAKREEVAVAHDILSKTELTKIFEAQGLSVHRVKHFRRFSLSGWLYRHTMFVLDKVDKQ